MQNWNLGRHFNCHDSNRNISHGGDWFVEGVVEQAGLVAPTQSIAWQSKYVSAFQAFRCHVNRHRGRIGPGKEDVPGPLPWSLMHK